MEVKAKSYTLRDEKGCWLGQIVLTSDGAFMSITDYGNFSFAWRSFGKERTLEEFENFIRKLDVGYFSSKMRQGMSYVAHGRNVDRQAEIFSERILPVLKNELNKKSVADTTDSYV